MTRVRKIQLLLWGYFWLLIFEGALRKWVLPGLSTPLLVARDPFAIMAVFLAWPYLRRWMAWIGWLWAIGLVACVLAVIVGHGDIITAAFGARILLFHMPLIFVFAAVFSRDDIWKFAKATLLISIPMLFLISAQYNLPQSHFVNLAPGGEETEGFRGALGRNRPPGTFSFTNGVAEFFALATALLAAWLVTGPRPMPKWIWLSAGAVLTAIPVSISRTLLVKDAIIGLFTGVASVLAGRQVQRFLLGGVGLAVVFFAVSRAETFQDASKVFEARWEEATDQEGGDEGFKGVLSKRVGSPTSGIFETAAKAPILGMGIGLGTNIGAMRIAGTKKFMVSEDAWGSVLGELGPILGLALIALRVCLALWLLRLGIRQARSGNTLPLILGGYALANVLLGQTSQPTALGFLVVGAGLMLAACNPTRQEIALRRRRVAARHPISAPLGVTNT